MSEALKDVLEAIDKAKGENTAVFYVANDLPFMDYVVITSASNSRQMQAIADYVRKTLLENHHGYRHIEGNDTSRWLLVDSDSVVVHVFEENERDIYGLDRLYTHCERVM